MTISIKRGKFWIAPALALATAGCATDGPVETRTYSLSGFDSIDANAGVNVVLKQGPFSITAEGPQNKLDRLSITKEGSRLKIGREGSDWSWFSWSVGRDVVTVVAPAYAGISANGGADVDAHDLKFGDMNVDLNGGADLNLSGECNVLTVKANGGADVNARELRCAAANVRANGGADVSVSVSGVARGDANGGADIDFYGNPTTFESEENGGGDVELHAS